MRYRLPFKRTGFEPEVVAQLESLRDAPLNHADRGLHHPIDIYAIASHDVWNNLNDLLDEVREVSDKQLYLAGSGDGQWEKRLKRQLDHTLDALAQFIDSCRTIITICCGSNESPKPTHPVRRFNDSIRNVADRILNLVNKIKHEQRVLQLVYFHGPGIFIPGYFAEGIIDSGVAGPDPTLHKDASTAFSLHRDIPMFVCIVYLASAALGQEIRQATKLPPADIEGRSAEMHELISQTLKKTSLLPLMFFPDEIAMPVPLVRFKEAATAASRMAELEFPAAHHKANTVLTGCRVTTSWTVRSVARSLQLPYFKGATEP
jgi:hypothetical protein